MLKMELGAGLCCLLNIDGKKGVESERKLKLLLVMDLCCWS